MKSCSRCKLSLADELFTKDSHSKDGLRAYCKLCRDAYIQKQCDRVREIKTICGCLFCGESYHPALEFHHINPAEKRFEISKGTQAEWKLYNEIQKCVILCRNCHVKVHNFIIRLPHGTSVRDQLKQKNKELNEYFSEFLEPDPIGRKGTLNKYYLANRDKIISRQSTEDRKSYMTAWREQNQDEIRAYQQKYRRQFRKSNTDG